MVAFVPRRHKTFARNPFPVKKGTSQKKYPNDTPLSKWLRRVRQENALDQEEFRSYIGVSRSYMGMLERGDRRITPEIIVDVLKAFPESPQPPTGELVPTGRVIGDRPVRWELPYAGVIPAASDWGDPLEGDEMRPIDPEFVAEGRYICIVAGDSCYPALHENDVTIWQPDRDPPLGVIVLAQRLEDGACTAKQLAYDDQLMRRVLRPVNPKYAAPPDEGGWEAVAKLVGVLRKKDGPKRTWGPWPDGLRPDHLV